MVWRGGEWVGVRGGMGGEEIDICGKGRGFWEEVGVFGFVWGVDGGRGGDMKLCLWRVVREFVLGWVGG